MADIARYPFVRHLRGTPTAHVEHVRHGRVVHRGTGLSFWFRPLTAVLSEVPVDDRELPLLFTARTADFQDVTVQATVTSRVVDPALAASRVDFSLDPETGRWRGTPLQQLGGLLTETAQQHALDLLAGMPLAEALATGVARTRARLVEGLAADARLAETGLQVVDVRVVAVRPEPEVEKALRTPTREQLQQEADRATYERRALAVERERAIGDNELQNAIALARREEELVAQRGTNARRTAEEEAAADAVRAEAQAARERRLGDARAQAQAAQVEALAGTPVELLLALAARELAGNLPQIGSLVLTPDLLAPALARLAGPAPEGTA